MTAYWCGWTVPDDVPSEHMVEAWPPKMQGWCSGLGDDYATWVGHIEAADADAAWAIVLSCYGESAGRVGKRWEPEPKPVGWQPGNRFPPRSAC